MSKGQLVLISGAILLFVLLLFANTKPDVAPKKALVAEGSLSLNSIADKNSMELQGQALERYKYLNGQIAGATVDNKPALYDSIISLADRSSKPLMAAQYALEKALLQNTAPSWFMAAERSFITARFTGPEEKKLLLASAANAYEKGLAIEPDNTDAKVNLAVCYVENTSDPMKGISILKEIVEKDPANVNAQINLGMFAIKSGQYDKAIERFEKLLQLVPQQIETYLYLADAYEKNGNKQGAVAALEKYMNLAEDETIKTEVKSYIDKLKNS